MGYTIFHGACPYCPSSDAYCEFDDGGHKCHSCGHYAPGSAYYLLAHPATQQNVTIRECPPLPEDATSILCSGGVGAGRAFFWCEKYYISHAEIARNYFQWSETEKLLIFPIYGEKHELLMWQGRYFGDNKKHPKYLTKGKKEDVLHILGRDKPGSLVLVEDLISAIKVARHQPAMPLWGSFLSADVARRISTQYKEAFIWLDYDKRKTSVKLAFDHCMRLHIEPIITELDPKCFSDEEIKKYLRRIVCVNLIQNFFPEQSS